MHEYRYTAIIFEKGQIIKHISSVMLPWSLPVGINHYQRTLKNAAKSIGVSESSIVVGNIRLKYGANPYTSPHPWV